MGRALGIKGIVLLLFLHPVALFAQSSWKIIREDSGVYYTDVDFVDKNNGWVVGGFASAEEEYTSHLIIHTSDGGNTWEYQKADFGWELYAVDFVDSLHGWAVGYNGTLLYTRDGGNYWRLQALLDFTAYDVCFVNSLKGWVVGPVKDKIAHTDDGGWTWTFQYAKDGAGDGFHSVFFVDSLCGWAFGCNIVHTTDGGRSWTVQYEALTSFGGNSFINSRVGWTIGEINGWAYIYNTVDGGEHWNISPLNTTASFCDICFIDSLKGWIVGRRYPESYVTGILHTTDGGRTWEWQESGLSGGFLTSVCFVDSSTGWAVGYSGCEFGYAVVLKYTSGPDVVESPPSDDSFHPKTFELFQNYPNPFNLETTIEFFLPKASRVSLSIYDIRGRVVRKLLNKRSLSSGYHKVLWNGRDQQGKSISSGVYLCILESEGNYSVKKLVAIK